MMLHPFQSSIAWSSTFASKPMTKSTERRLRKMTRLYRPTSFGVSVRAHVLCVGTAIVYRAELTVAMRAAHLLVPSWRNRHHQTWIIALSHAKFLGFIAEARRVLQHPAIAALLVPRRSTTSPIEQFYRRLATIVRRSELLRVTFECPSIATSHMSDSKHTVEAFVDECWRALMAVMPVLAARVDVPTGLSRETLTLYVLLRDLLAFPESLLEADQVYAKAILSLRDVEAGTLEARRGDCSICLEPMVTCAVEHRSLSAPVVLADRLFAVQLPCGHVFHENCIMAWLRENPTCPECRARADVATTTRMHNCHHSEQQHVQLQEEPSSGDPIDGEDEEMAAL